MSNFQVEHLEKIVNHAKVIPAVNQVRMISRLHLMHDSDQLIPSIDKTASI